MLGGLKVFLISKRKKRNSTSKLSVKEGKQSEKVLASLPPSRSISFPSKYANFHFDTIFTVFAGSPQNG